MGLDKLRQKACANLRRVTSKIDIERRHGENDKVLQSQQTNGRRGGGHNKSLASPTFAQSTSKVKTMRNKFEALAEVQGKGEEEDNSWYIPKAKQVMASRVCRMARDALGMDDEGKEQSRVETSRESEVQDVRPSGRKVDKPEQVLQQPTRPLKKAGKRITKGCNQPDRLNESKQVACNMLQGGLPPPR